ncbi:MAG: MlaD family protein [Clostridia bacterium]|nr:MlaD family protein [Clostridia bacterium]
MNTISYIKIALFFIILGGAGAGYIVLSVNGIGSLNTVTYEAVIDDASGLSTRSKVYLAGVPVGKVQSIDLIGTEARLKLVLLKDVELRRDAVLSRRPSSLLGTSVLNLDPGTDLTPIITPGTVINTSPPPADLSTAMGLVQDIGGQLVLLLEEFRTNQMALLSISLETINSIAKQIDDQSEAQINRISRILEAAALITERTDRILQNSEKDISGSVTDIHAAIANIRLITGEIAAGRGNIGQAVYDESFYKSILATAEKTENAAGKLGEALDNISSLAKNADNVVTNAGEIVQRAVGLGIQVDANARYDINARAARGAASIRLDPRSNDRWYRIGISSVPEGIVSRTVKETTDASGQLVQWTDTTETKYSVGVDAELARRFSILTLRGGLLETTAGFGLDIQPFKWMSLSGELFRFNAGERPNLRSSLTFFPFFDPDSDKPWNWIYLKGGMNDSLNGSRDFFIGGGVRFADREVKGLVGLVPLFNN